MSSKTISTVLSEQVELIDFEIQKATNRRIHHMKKGLEHNPPVNSTV